MFVSDSRKTIVDLHWEPALSKMSLKYAVNLSLYNGEYWAGASSAITQTGDSEKFFKHFIDISLQGNKRDGAYAVYSPDTV